MQGGGKLMTAVSEIGHKENPGVVSATSKKLGGKYMAFKLAAEAYGL